LRNISSFGIQIDMITPPEKCDRTGWTWHLPMAAPARSLIAHIHQRPGLLQNTPFFC
jgi:hypothetical protein